MIVRSGHRSGLLLPDIEGINTVEEQIAIARRKAGIGPMSRWSSTALKCIATVKLRPR